MSFHVGMCLTQGAVVAEWLRRLTRNQFPSGSVGSNPTDRGIFLTYDILQNFVELCCDTALKVWHRWFSGRMLACHAGGPGSIPGRCNVFLARLKIFGKLGKTVEAPGIDPGTSRMLSERSTI